MKMTDARAKMLAGIALIVLTNAFVLGGVYYNRSGDAARKTVLTERELGLPYRYGINSENSGMALRLSYRIASGKEHKYFHSGVGLPDWFDKGKLAALGYDMSFPADTEQNQRIYKKMRDRGVYLVLEYDGATWQAALASAQQNLKEKTAQFDTDPNNKLYASQLKSAEQMLEREKTGSSRLFVIDVGIDEMALRKQYADSSHYIIARGKVGVNVNYMKGQQWQVSGNIRSVSIDQITVPWKDRPLFESLQEKKQSQIVKKTGRSWPSEHLPRYQVSVAYGKRLEPWVLDVSLTQARN